MFSKKFILNIIVDWDTWISLIETRAVEKDIWIMINSVLSIKTLLFNESISSEFFVAVNDNSIASKVLFLYNHRKKHYKILTLRYDKLVREFDIINALI